ncbi:MAG: tetratricopeptide repeat protein [Planctomycetes bacterium]|nr:tetratricopeptide repeat protein [Planctomycetota bacterium]
MISKLSNHKLATKFSRRRVVVMLCCLVAVSAFGVPVEAADSDLDDYNLAIGLYKKNRWKLAAESFHTFLKGHPRHEKAEPARLYLGIALENDEKYSAARTVFREFLSKHPKSKNLPNAMYRVAECSNFLNDLESAEREFSAFLKKYPDHKLAEWALPYLADAQLRRNKPQTALKNFQKALEKFPRSELAVDARFGSARCHEQLKHYSQAIEIYTKLAANRSGSRAAEAHMNLAAVYFDTEKFLEAAETYAEFSKLFPKSLQGPNAQLNAGYAYYELGDYDKAITQFELAAKDKQLAATAGYWKGVSLKSLGRYSEAVIVFEAAFKTAGKTPLLGNIHFQWADSALRGGRYETARTLFLDYLKRNPKSEKAADSLHFAAEASLRHAEQLRGVRNKAALAETQQLLDRFGREFPNAPIRMHHELLQGRLHHVRGGEPNLQAAVQIFQKVIDRSSVPHTQSLARFQLARTYKKLDDHQSVLNAIAPLVKQVQNEGAASEFLDVLILEGTSRLALEQYKDASSSMTLYLTLQPTGNQSDQALSTRAAALASLGNATAQKQAQADLDRLSEEYQQSPLTLPAWHHVAEIAYEAHNWNWSGELFSTVIEQGKNTPYHVLGLSGLAWTQFQQKNYLAAAESFGRVVSLYPDEKVLAPESAYKRGESLQNAEKLQDAIAAYTKAFQKYAPVTGAEPGDEQKKGSGYYAYRSGLQAARTLRMLNRVKEADAAYEQLLKRFPHPKDLDNRLDEWALLNYEAKNYDRSDEIFRRLLKETPQSVLADNARFSLAESDLNAGRLKAAQQAFRKIEADSKADDEVRETSLFHLVGIAVENREFKEMVAVSEQLLKRYPKSKHRYAARFYRAEAQFQLSQFDETNSALSELKNETDPMATEADWFPRVWILLGELQLRRKKYDAVEQTIEELRSRLPNSPLLYQADEILGRSYKNRARFDEARTAFQRVIDHPQGSRTETAAKSQFLLAETYLIQKQYREALLAYFKVYSSYKYPEWQAPALYQVGVCDEALGQWKNAVEMYEDLLQEFPKSEYAERAKSRLPVARKKVER